MEELSGAEAAKRLLEAELSAEEDQMLDGPNAPYGEEGEEADHSSSEIPEWVKMPDGLKFPKGIQVTFVLMRSKNTFRPDKGDRQCILWPLTEADEKMALRRSRGDFLRTIDECAKQMIRAIDGKKADWTGTPGSTASVDVFWNEMGAAYRTQIKSLYNKMHSLGMEESADFFANCVAVRTVQS